VPDNPESATTRGRAYTGERVTVYYDARRCLHFAECIRGLPGVFDVKELPWIQPDHAQPERVAEVIRRCPSGALHYELAHGSPEHHERPTKVHPVEDGPLTVRGELVIDTSEGELTEVRAALCRCGQTQNQPFCDHECKRTGWKS
jgi:uncharacterized Fe-S cluster protein YjdI